MFSHVRDGNQVEGKLCYFQNRQLTKPCNTHNHAQYNTPLREREKENYNRSKQSGN